MLVYQRVYSPTGFITAWWWLEHVEFFSVLTYWEFHHPDWRTPSFFRGVETTNQYIFYIMVCGQSTLCGWWFRRVTGFQLVSFCWSVSQKIAFTGSLHRLFIIAFAHWASHCVCLWFEYDLCSLGAAVFGKYCPGNLRATAKSCRWEDSATQKDSRNTQHWLQCYFSTLFSPWIINEPSMNHQNVVVKPNFKSHPQFITIFGGIPTIPQVAQGICHWGARLASNLGGLVDLDLRRPCVGAESKWSDGPRVGVGVGLTLW